MRRPFAAALTLCALSAGQAGAGMVEDCLQSADAELQVSACSEAIDSGRWEGEGLAWAYGNRGNAHAALRQPAKALSDYSTAIDLDPDFALSWHNRGLVFAALGDQERALDDFTEAVQVDPDLATAWGSRGVALRELGRYEEALDDLDRAIELDPDTARHYQNRANVRCALGQVEGSVEDRLTAIRRGHFSPELVQRVLAGKGYYDGPVDGAFGRGSVDALRAWTEAGCD